VEDPLDAPDQRPKKFNRARAEMKNEDPVRFEMSSPQLGFLESFYDRPFPRVRHDLNCSPYCIVYLSALCKGVYTPCKNRLLSLCLLDYLPPSCVSTGSGQAQRLPVKKVSVPTSQSRRRLHPEVGCKKGLQGPPPVTIRRSLLPSANRQCSGISDGVHPL